MIITMSCNGCYRQVTYLATDLIKVLGPFHQVHVPPWPCGRCGSQDLIKVSWEVITASRIAQGLTVRRPVKQITRWIWRDEKA